MTNQEAVTILREMATSIRLDVERLIAHNDRVRYEWQEYLDNAEACDRGADALVGTTTTQAGPPVVMTKGDL